MSVLLLLGFASLVSKFKHPFKFALGYAALTSLLGLAFEHAFKAVVIDFVVSYIFCAIYFYLLDRYSDSLMVWLLILIGGPFVFFVLPIMALG